MEAVAITTLLELRTVRAFAEPGLEGEREPLLLGVAELSHHERRRPSPSSASECDGRRRRSRSRAVGRTRRPDRDALPHPHPPPARRSEGGGLMGALPGKTRMSLDGSRRRSNRNSPKGKTRRETHGSLPGWSPRRRMQPTHGAGRAAALAKEPDAASPSSMVIPKPCRRRDSLLSRNRSANGLPA